MKRIELKALRLENFKGVAVADYIFGETTEVRGGNGTGKSTIYEAYLWAIFGKNPYGNDAKVQPLDENNEPIHNVVTSVTAELTVDGLPIKVEHLMEEDWSKVRGTSTMKLNGLTHSYKVNDVPMTATEFTSKLNGIANLEDWFMLSSINILPSMKMEDRRRKLQAIAPDFDLKALMKDYPAIAKAAAEGKTVEELKAQNSATKAKAKAELDIIPARLDEQERVRVEIDKDADEAQLEAKIAELKTREQAIREGYVVESSMILQNELRELNTQIANEEDAIRSELEREKSRLTGEKAKAEYEIRNISLRVHMAETDIKNCKRQIEEGAAKLAEYKAQYDGANATKYEELEINGICPTCGQPLPASQIESAKAKALAEFNKDKADKIAQILACARKVKDRVEVLKPELEKLQGELEANNAKVAALQADVEAYSKAIEELQPRDVSEAYKANVAHKAEVLASIEQIKQKSQDANKELQAELEQVIDLIKHYTLALNDLRTARATNRKVDERKQELLDQQKTLAQVLADAENVEAQIDAYKKRYITAVEQSVSSLFGMVRWKMYQPNTTREGEKPICQPIIDGIPYEQQNRATQMNAGVDMINGFSRGLELCVPLFIDNKESVSDLIETDAQTITLTVVPGAELTIVSL